jgi:hypothetical protein
MTKLSSLYVCGCSRLKIKGMKELVQANADEKIKEDKRAVRSSWLYYPVFGNSVALCCEYMLGYCALHNLPTLVLLAYSRTTAMLLH